MYNRQAIECSVVICIDLLLDFSLYLPNIYNATYPCQCLYAQSNLFKVSYIKVSKALLLCLLIQLNSFSGCRFKAANLVISQKRSINRYLRESQISTSSVTI